MSTQAGGEAELLATRRRKLEALREDGVDPFPHAYPGVTPIAEVKAPFDGLEPGAETDERRRVAGRLAARREQGKAAFLDLVDRSGRIQLMARVNELGEEKMRRLLSLDLGDLIGAEGTVLRTRRGELSLRRRGLRGAGQVAAPAAREAPRAPGRRAAPPPPRARPDRQRGDARALHHAREGDHRDAPLARRARLHRGRDAGAAADLRRRAGAARSARTTTRSTARCSCASPPSSTSSG